MSRWSGMAPRRRRRRGPAGSPVSAARCLDCGASTVWAADGTIVLRHAAGCPSA